MKKHFSRYDLRGFFTLIVFIEICGISLITFLFNLGLEYFLKMKLGFPSLLWSLIASICIGGGLSVVINRRFFGPIRRLGTAMNDVAKGDFKIRLEEKTKLRDIQEIYENFNLMVQELDATEVLQSDFISNVSHEFKTPINAIEGYATMLQDTPQVTEEQVEYIEKIMINTRRLSELIGNVLLMSKIENQAIPGQVKKYRLDEQIRMSIMMLETMWEPKEIDFDVELDPISITGNESLLSHVWNNLISNAIKFNCHGGLIAMRLKQIDGHIEFTIDDAGPGISEEDQKHIFDKFFQADSSHKQEGNGLGLALVNRILDVCGGHISVDNLPDGGCRFTVQLPADTE